MEKKIGYTQGTFDMFHIGHLNLIRNAKKHCDYLIVGVNADDLVESYKNKRPIVPLEERAEIVRAIRYVDEVIVTTTLDKKQVWEKVHFNEIYIGDDWKGNARWEKTGKDYRIYFGTFELRNYESRSFGCSFIFGGVDEW